MARIPITLQGYEKVQNILKQLKTVDRPKIIDAIVEARSHGDLSENAEYQAAKEKQTFIEGRIANLESKLSLFDVIDPKKLQGQSYVRFSATVKFWDTVNEKSFVYQIVGEEEADVDVGRISIASPLAKASLGKQVGDAVTLHTPGGGIAEYEVESIDYI